MKKRGINFKQYYNMLVALDEGNIGEFTRKEYRQLLIKYFAEDLNKNFLNGHVYEENIKMDTRNHFGYFKIKYYTSGIGVEDEIYINFLHDCIQINGLYIKY